MDQFEIEVKLPLKNLKETLKLLTDQGFHETAEIREEDTYFNSIYHDVKKRDEALRIRTSTDCRSGISKTQIDRHRHPHLQRFPHHIIQCLHQLCRPWKSIWHRRPHFYYN